MQVKGNEKGRIKIKVRKGVNVIDSRKQIDKLDKFSNRSNCLQTQSRH